MITLKQLIETNKLIKKTDIKGKMYADVAEKVKAFRRIIPCGKIETEVVKADASVAVIRATVYDGEGRTLATGTAYECRDAKGSMVNRTSYLENCETSAVGRALSSLGLGLNFGVEMKFEGSDAENLEMVNKTMRPIEVKGRSYVEVKERVAAFRKLHPSGAILTEMKALDDTLAMFQTTIIDENGSVLATGSAFEETSKSGVNENNFIENAETSSIGRALAFAGYGIDADICSADEVESAYLQQEASKTLSADMIEELRELCAKADVEEEKILNAAKVGSMEEITVAMFGSLVKKLNATIKAHAEAKAAEKPAKASQKLKAAAEAYRK